MGLGTLGCVCGGGGEAVEGLSGEASFRKSEEFSHSGRKTQVESS